MDVKHPCAEIDGRGKCDCDVFCFLAPTLFCLCEKQVCYRGYSVCIICAMQCCYVPSMSWGINDSLTDGQCNPPPAAPLLRAFRNIRVLLPHYGSTRTGSNLRKNTWWQIRDWSKAFGGTVVGLCSNLSSDFLVSWGSGMPFVRDTEGGSWCKS
jgi:hypothetical protein